MTYRELYGTCYTSPAREIANDLRYLHGFQSEADEDDVEFIHETDLTAMGDDGYGF